ncbi:hypothetical protein [Streptomyces sp. PR69]|uniref:hypothetical protein n=1 Tax=Streptomyces sp. PR69 TaxID=2984950 RepID=UPI003A5BA80C
MPRQTTPESASRGAGSRRAESADSVGGAACSAAGGGAPKGLLQQMEELMAALNADLSRLDADLQSTDRNGGQGRQRDDG